MKTLVTALGIVLLVGAIAIPVLAHGPVWRRFNNNNIRDTEKLRSIL